MSSTGRLTRELEDWLGRLHRGDAASLEEARAEIIRLASGRLEHLASKMLKNNPRVRRWEETADVLQNALVRLHRALETVRPDSARQLFGLAAAQIRRELVDMARRHYGPMGEGAHHHTDRQIDGAGPAVARASDGRRGEPSSLAEWTEFHERVDQLPETEREVFQLLWYEGLRQEEAAAILGVTTRTIKNRWRSAKILLQEMLGQGPEDSS